MSADDRVVTVVGTRTTIRLELEGSGADGYLIDITGLPACSEPGHVYVGLACAREVAAALQHLVEVASR